MNFWEWCTAHSIELIIAAVCVAILIMIIVINLAIAIVHKRKKKSADGKIYKTTEGFLGDYPLNKKRRRVAIVEQRKDDGAVAIVKIYSQKGRNGKAFIANLILTPEEHKSLTENSIVGSQVIIGIKQKNGTYKPIFTRELTETGDALTEEELDAVKKGVHNDTPQHRETYKKRMKRWRRHFRK